MSAAWGRDSVNREHLYPNAALRPDRVLDQRVLVERQRHQLCAFVISSSTPAIWTPLASPVCGFAGGKWIRTISTRKISYRFETEFCPKLLAIARCGHLLAKPQPQNFSDLAHRQSLGWHLIPR